MTKLNSQSKKKSIALSTLYSWDTWLHQLRGSIDSHSSNDLVIASWRNVNKWYWLHYSSIAAVRITMDQLLSTWMWCWLFRQTTATAAHTSRGWLMVVILISWWWWWWCSSFINNFLRDDVMSCHAWMPSLVLIRVDSCKTHQCTHAWICIIRIVRTKLNSQAKKKSVA